MSLISVFAIIIVATFGLMLVVYCGSRLASSAYFRSKKEFLRSHLLKEKEQEDE